MNILKTFFNRRNATAKNNHLAQESIYEIPINTLQNKPLDLSQFKGKYLLIVNVASKCGFTPQYKELQELYNTYSSQLEIIGIPCNQFGKQEPGNSDSISEFCELNYGVTFTITEKVEVKGSNQHPLYAWLTQSRKNGFKDSKVKWNFQKYLVSPEGELIDYFYSMTSPKSNKITKYFK